MTHKPGMAERLLSALFVAGQAIVMLTSGCGHPLVVAVSIAGLLLGLLRRHRYSLGRFAHASGLVVIGLILAGPRLLSIWMQGDISQLFEMFAEFLLVVQTLEFWRPQRATTNNYLPGLGCLNVASLVLSFDASLRGLTLQWTYFLFLLLLALVMRPDLPRLLASKRKIEFGKAITLLLVFLTAIASGALFQSELRRDLPELQERLSIFRVGAAESLFAQNDGRLVEELSLTSVSDAQRKNPEAVVFTVEGDKPPGYMRTMSFQAFDGVQWRAWKRRGVRRMGVDVRLAVSTIPNGVSAEDAELVEGGTLYPVARQPVGNTERFVVRIPAGRGKVVPLPLTTAWLFARVRRMALDPHGAIVPGMVDSEALVAYRCEADRVVPEARYLSVLQTLPTQDREFVKQLSDSVVGDETTVQGTARALERWFGENFAYSLDSPAGAKAPGSTGEERTALRAFLEYQHAAHCEFFATATVFMLRAQGIPCRISTGYLVYELNDSQDYYVAANRHAHAWAEAWDAESDNWIVVESTPGISNYVRQFENNRNGDDADTAIATADDYNETFWSNLRIVIITRFNSIISSRWSWVVPVMLAMVLAAYFRGRRTSDNECEYAKHRHARKLREADRLAARRGFVRGANETCHQFAGRLQLEHAELASWYLDYAAQRYRSEPAILNGPP